VQIRLLHLWIQPQRRRETGDMMVARAYGKIQ